MRQHKVAAAYGRTRVIQSFFVGIDTPVRGRGSHFISDVMCRKRLAGSIKLRLPMMVQASAPTTFDMKPSTAGATPSAAHGAVTPRTASPAPTRSTTLMEKAGTVNA